MLHEKSIAELALLLGKRETSSRELVTAYLERIDSLDEKINAFITVERDSLLARADESDRRRGKGEPLSAYDGIPVAVKDNILTEGVRTTCASRILENFIPPYSASAYSRLADKGFLLLGKTNMDEFAMGSSTETSFFGPVRNPYDYNRIPGGSSGGSAAAVAASMAPAALGSDTGGSIRQPAAFCGVAGIKPTYGRVSRYGLVAFASSLDQIGAFGGTVDDAALLLALISGRDVNDSTSVEREVNFQPEAISPEMRGMRIGVPEEYFRGTSPEIAERIKKEIETLGEKGAGIEPISLKYTEYAVPVYYLIATAEASANLARYDGVRYGYRSAGGSNLLDLYTRTRSEGFGKEVKRRIILGTFSLSSGYYDAYYLKALKGRRLIIDDFKSALSRVDVIVAPVTTTSAFRIGEMIDDPLQMYMSDVLTISANLAGIPAMSVPVGLDSSGLPIGLQIMGSHFQEQTVLRVAKAIEEGTKKIRPPL